MKIKYISDLHIDYMPDFTLPFSEGEDEQILVIAGDVVDGMMANVLPFITDCISRFKEVILVPGNHDYYHFNLHDVDNYWSLQEQRFKNFHYLENKSIEIDGVRFIGCCLWSGLNGDEFHARYAARYVGDFEHIKIKDKPFTQGEMIQLHNKSVAFIHQELKKVNMPNVVITHFVPLMALRSHNRPSEGISHYFYNDLKDLIDIHSSSIKHWIYGHSHDISTRWIGNINFVSNAKGQRTCKDFDFNKIIEIDK